MDVMEELEALIEEIRNAKNVPFSASAMVDRKGLIDRLEALRQAAPEELKQARWLMRDREELLSRSQKESERMMVEAQSERDRMVARTEIVAAANREADKIIEEAKGRAREIRMEAEDYVDAKLASFEVVLQKTLTAVEKGRESLRGRLDLGPREPEEEPPQGKVEPQETVSETGNVRVRRP